MTDPILYLQTPVSLSTFNRETNFSSLLFLQSIQPKLLQNWYSRFVGISPFYLDVVNWPKVDRIWALSGWWLTTGSLSDEIMHIVKTLITMAMVVWYYHPSQSMIIQCITDNVWKCLLYESQSPTEKRRYVWYNVWYWARWGMLWGVWQRYHSHLFSYHIIINAITCTSKCMKIQLNKNSLHIYDTKQCQIDVIYLLLQIWFSLLSSFYMFVHVLE